MRFMVSKVFCSTEDESSVRITPLPMTLRQSVEDWNK